MKIKDFIKTEQAKGINIYNSYPDEYLEFDILLLVRAGSHLYGTNTETSDEDYRGIFIIPNEYLHGLKSNYVSQLTFGELEKGKGVKADNVFYEVGRFMELLMSSNPNILELLHFRYDKNLIYVHTLMETELLPFKPKFITKQCRTSVAGYAIAQIKKARGQSKYQNWSADRIRRKTPLDFITVYDKKNELALKDYLLKYKLNQKNCGVVAIPHTYDKLLNFIKYHVTFRNKIKLLSFHLSKQLQTLVKYGIVDFSGFNNSLNKKMYELEGKIEKIKGYDNISNKNVFDIINSFKQLLYPFYKAKKNNKNLKEYKYLITFALFYKTHGLFKHILNIIRTPKSWKYIFNNNNWIDNFVKLKINSSYKGIIKDTNGIISNELRLSSIPKKAKIRAFMVYDMNGYSTHCKEYKQYQEWIKNRNEYRYVENKQHNQKYDSKNIMHCVRLLRMSKEIAQNKGMIVTRPDADYLLKIRRGEVDLEQVLNESAKEIKLIDALYKDNTTLPLTINTTVINNILLNIRHLYYDRYYNTH